MILSSINICKVTIKLTFARSLGKVKTSGFALDFQHFPRDLADVNEWKVRFDPSSKRPSINPAIRTPVFCLSNEVTQTVLLSHRD